MSATNRRPLATDTPDGGVRSRHHDGHGYRIIEARPDLGGVLITITHSDGRKFERRVNCLT